LMKMYFVLICSDPDALIQFFDPNCCTTTAEKDTVCEKLL